VVNAIYRLNAKLGGVNGFVQDSALDHLKSKKTMFVGADVTHPGNRIDVASCRWLMMA
jgi:hypothetical protein